MSEILSQEEIEALLSTLTGESSEDSPTTNSPSMSSEVTHSPKLGRPEGSKKTYAYGIYDFRSPDKFSKDHLRTLQMLSETFGRLCTSTLSAYLRSTVQIELISLEQVPYDEYLRAIKSSAFTIFSLPPLTGQMVMEIEFSVLFGMLDRMLGGTGKVTSRTDLTEIERPLVSNIINRMFSSMKSSWESVLSVNPTIESIETNTQFVQIVPPNDVVITILFEVRLGEQRGAMSMCIPYMVLKPVTQKLGAQRWLSNVPRKPSAAHRQQVSWQIGRTVTPCSVRLGQSRINIREFLDLREGDVIKLDQETDEEILMLVGNQPKFKGKPALKGKKLVFSISRLVED